ncbi:MAG TPA: S9 family peptidase, partial [Pseudoalteromonas sp.]|nr:S9 family peptidase [Pseudoalteromonas sp.]
MRISSPWTTKNKLLKQAATFFALGSLSLTAIAAPLDKSNIEFIGPLGENMQVKPFQTPHGQVIINNLLEQLQRNTQSVSVFGKKHSWQPFNKVNALTLGGLQALKFNIETTRYSQGTLTIKGIENAQLFIDAKLQKGDNHTYSLSLTNGSHSVIVVAQQVANWNNVSL